MIVGGFELLFGLVLALTCNSFGTSGGCAGREDPAGGLVLSIAGSVVLLAGSVVYLVGRRSSKS